MTIEFLDPRGEPETVSLPYELSADLTSVATVGLLANGFPDSVAFLDQVEAAMRSLRPELEYARYDKGSASAIADDTMIDTIVTECQAVVTAYGH
jgi:hypothetical protein